MSTTITHVLDSILDAQADTATSTNTAYTPLVQTQIFIGLNDKDTKHQKLGTDRYVSHLKRICQEFQVPFSFNINEGGYIHDNGEYTEETSIVLTLIDVAQETVDELAQEVCLLFHQESVLVTVDHIEARSVRAVL